MIISIKSSEIANFLGAKLIGKDIVINKAATLGNLSEGSVSFIKEMNENRAEIANKNLDCLFLVPSNSDMEIIAPHIILDNPRLAIGRVLSEFFQPKRIANIAKTAIVSENAKIGKNVTIGEYCIISDNVEIGDDCDIRHHVVIARNCKIGNNTIIKSHAVIGEEGFATEKDDDGNNQKIAHIGGVEIGNYVEIGATSVVCCGTIDPTRIGNYTKIDDNVFLAHNVQIGENCTIIANSEVSGSVVLGENVWIAPQCTVLESVKIGANAYIGLGAVVIRDCEDGWVYVGNPAKKLRER